MIKKMIIEKDDEQKMLKWDGVRIKNFVEKVELLEFDLDQNYVLVIDIADDSLEDKSVVCYFKITDGEYNFIGCEDI